MRSLIFFLLIIASSSNGQFYQDNKSEVKVYADQETIDNLFSRALRFPKYFCRSDEYKKFINVFAKNPGITSDIISSDSLKIIITNSKNRKTIIASKLLLMVRNVANSDNINICKSGLEAGSLTFRELNDPQTALTLYKAFSKFNCPDFADSITFLERYMEYDLPIKKIYDMAYTSTKISARIEYAVRLENALKKYDQTNLRISVIHRLGDVYYSTKDYRKSLKWYKKIKKAAPEIIRSTSIAYHYEIARNHVKRKNTLYIVYALYIIMAIALIIQSVMGQGFNIKTFSTQLGKTSVLYILFMLVLFFIDGLFLQGRIQKILSTPEAKKFLILPVVPLSMLNISFSVLLDTFLTGFLPVLFILLLNAFKKSFPKPVMILLLIIISVTSWTHYSLRNVYDELLKTKGTFSGVHFLFDGELEDLLIKNPKKALKANPALLESDNESLKNFLRNNPLEIDK